MTRAVAKRASKAVAATALLTLSFLGAPVPAAAPAAAPSPASARADAQPSVLLILTDDMRYDDLEFMPHVQSLLVDKGTTFDRFYSPFPLCCPARASILTGKYAHNHGVLSNTAPYGGYSAFDDESTLATWLDATHQSGLVGKYLNQYGAKGNESLYVPPGWDFWRGSPIGTYNYRHIGLNMGGASVNVFRQRNATKVIGDQSSEFLSRHGREPFFLLASFVAPHSGKPREADDLGLATPYVGPTYRDTYAGPAHPTDPTFNEPDVSDKRPSVRSNPPLTRRQIASVKESFAQRRESLRMVDDQVARLVGELRERRELASTYIIFASDNGYLQGEHRIYRGKGLPYSPASHVPLVIRGPGAPAGQRVDGMAGLHDLAPTILELAGVREPPGQVAFDGQSLVPMLTDPAAGDERTLVLEAGDNNGGYTFQGVLRGDGWKYVEFTTAGVNEVEMYDHESDPFEDHNLSDDPLYDAVEAELKAELDRLRQCSGRECD